MKLFLRLAALGAALAIGGAAQAQAQQYPTKPVKIIVPFAAGGITDIGARIIAAELSKRLGQQFYVENQGGAGGNLGMGNAARSQGDGYTVLFASSSIVVNPSLYNKVPFDIDKDFIPVTKAGGSPNAWLVNPSFPAKTMKELIEVIRKEPGKYSVASPGAGTTPSLSIEQMKLALKLDMITVPFAGGGPATQSTLAGHTPITCGALGNAGAIIRDGKLRALAVTAKKRSVAMPEIPTLEEFGIKDQEAETMTGVFVPAGTPKPVVDLLQKNIAEIVKEPTISKRLLELGIEPDGNSQAEFAAYVKAEVAKWRKVIEEAKIPRI
jgi:tripartite-type tricarboxylate transporter receptor subunit TctC